MGKYLGSRGKAICALIEHIIELRHLKPSYLRTCMNSYRQRMSYMRTGRSTITLEAFLNIMIALRCEVLVIPKDAPVGFSVYRLTEFPDNDGNVMEMPSAKALEAASTLPKPKPPKGQRKDSVPEPPVKKKPGKEGSYEFRKMNRPRTYNNGHRKKNEQPELNRQSDPDRAEQP